MRTDAEAGARNVHSPARVVPGTRCEPQILHLHGYGDALQFVVRWCWQHGLPVVYQEHSTPDATPRRWYRPPGSLDEVTLVVAVSAGSAAALREVCGVTRPIRVIPPIAGLRDLEPRRRPEPRVRDGVIRVVTTARLSDEKGVSVLVTAAERVIASRPHVAFTVHGDGYLRQDLTAQIERAGLEAHVHLNGAFSRQDLPAIMSGADIFALPSLTEGYPLSIVEAMAWGIPVVATNVGGVPELIRHGVNGLLCTAGDPDSLARALLELVDDPVRALEMGAAAREFYKSSLEPENLVARYGEAYAEAMGMG